MGFNSTQLARQLEKGFVRVTPGHEFQPFIFSYLGESADEKISSGKWKEAGFREDGSKSVVSAEGKVTRATTAWAIRHTTPVNMERAR